jgi:hypothetical protein
MKCSGCKLDVEIGRAKLGLHLCMVCGDVQARQSIREKQKYVAPAFNKGGLQYIGGADAKRNMLDAGRKTTADATPLQTTSGVVRKQVVVTRRKRVGVAYLANGDRRTIFEGEDCSRWQVRSVVWLKG